MTVSPHPVICPKKAIRAAKTDCTRARAAVRTFLNSNPATITETTLGALNHVSNCHEKECKGAWERIKERFQSVVGRK